MGNSPKDVLDVIDITESPSFTESMFNDAQTVKECPNKGDHMDSTPTEDVTGLGSLEVPRKSPSSGTNGPSLSPKLINRLPALSVDPNQKRSIVISISEDARVLSSPVGVASYLRVW